MHNKKKNNIESILIAIVVTIVLVCFISWKVLTKIEQKDKSKILLDAKTMLAVAEAQNSLDKLESKDSNCLYIYGYEGIYKNSGNYVGSVDLSSSEPYIELSDGKYYVKGTSKKLKIIKSNLTASTTCNR